MSTGMGPKKPFYTTQHIDILRELTNIGDEVDFEIVTNLDFEHDHYTPHKREVKLISGHVIEKYQNQFKLDDGKYYTWKQFLMGCSSAMKVVIDSHTGKWEPYVTFEDRVIWHPTGSMIFKDE